MQPEYCNNGLQHSWCKDHAYRRAWASVSVAVRTLRMVVFINLTFWSVYFWILLLQLILKYLSSCNIGIYFMLISNICVFDLIYPISKIYQFNVLLINIVSISYLINNIIKYLSEVKKSWTVTLPLLPYLLFAVNRLLFWTQ